MLIKQLIFGFITVALADLQQVFDPSMDIKDKCVCKIYFFIFNHSHSIVKQTYSKLSFPEIPGL